MLHPTLHPLAIWGKEALNLAGRSAKAGLEAMLRYGLRPPTAVLLERRADPPSPAANDRFTTLGGRAAPRRVRPSVKRFHAARHAGE